MLDVKGKTSFEEIFRIRQDIMMSAVINVFGAFILISSLSEKSEKHKEHIPIEFGSISLSLIRYQNMKMSWSQALLTYASAWSIGHGQG